jgi:hypothetical protein
MEKENDKMYEMLKSRAKEQMAYDELVKEFLAKHPEITKENMHEYPPIWKMVDEYQEGIEPAKRERVKMGQPRAAEIEEK